MNYYKSNKNLLNIKKIDLDNNLSNYNDLLNSSSSFYIYLQDLLINSGTGLYNNNYEHDDKTILFDNNNGVLDKLFNDLSSEYDLNKIVTELNSNFISKYNLLQLNNVILKSQFLDENKKYLILRNNISQILFNNLSVIVNSETNLDNINKLVLEYYKINILPSIKDFNSFDLTPNIILFNSNYFVVFNDEYYYDYNGEVIKISNTKIDQILQNIEDYKLLTIDFSNFELSGETVLNELETIKQDLPNLFYTYKISNLNVEDNFINKINDILADNYTISGIQKYYFYKNCLLTYSEYQEIPIKSNFAILEINNVDNFGSIEVDNDNNILNINLLVNNTNYSNNQLVCLSNGNGKNAYGKIILDGTNQIFNITLQDVGINYVKNERVIIEPYSLPDNLEFIDESFKYLRRKTDLPFEIKLNYETNILSRRISNKNYILLEQILYTSNYYLLNDNNNTFESTSFLDYTDNLLSTSQSSNTFFEYNNETETYDTKYYTIVELNNSSNYLFSYIKINSSLYNDIYILYPTSETNKYEIKTEYIGNTSGTYSTGLKLIYSNTELNNFINYFNLYFYFNNNNIKEFTNYLNNFDYNLNYSVNIYDIINNILLDIDNNNYNRLLIYSSDLVYYEQPFVNNSLVENFNILSKNSFNINNVINLNLKFNINKSTYINNINNILKIYNNNFNKYLKIIDEINDLIDNPYKKMIKVNLVGLKIWE